MATLPGGLIINGPLAGLSGRFSGRSSMLTSGPIKYIKMIATDATIDTLQDSWVVTGTEDMTGVRYTAGVIAFPLRNVRILHSWFA